MVTMRRRPWGVSPKSRIGPTSTSMSQTCFSSGGIVQSSTHYPRSLPAAQFVTSDQCPTTEHPHGLATAVSEVPEDRDPTIGGHQRKIRAEQLVACPYRNDRRGRRLQLVLGDVLTHVIGHAIDRDEAFSGWVEREAVGASPGWR